MPRLRVSGSVGRGFWTAHMQGGPGGLCLLGRVRGVLEMSGGSGKSQEQPERRHRAECPREAGPGCTQAPSVAPKVLFPHSTEGIAEACRLTVTEHYVYVFVSEEGGLTTFDQSSASVVPGAGLC